MTIGKEASDWDQFQTAWLYQMRFYLRTYRFLVPVILGVFFGSITIAFILYATTPVVAAGGTPASLIGGLLSFVGIIGGIGAAFLGGDATSMDTGSQTGYYTLVQPVRRFVLLMGRYAAAYVLLLASVMIIYAFLIFDSIWVYNSASLWIPASIGLLMLAVFAYTSLAFALSVLVDRPVYGIVLTFIVIFVGQSIISSLLMGYGIEPWFLASYGAEVVSLIFSYPWPHFAAGMWQPTLIEGISILVLYTVIGLAIALLIFNRQEVKT
jgi:ABC-2 type transport system permease protein